MSWGTGAVLSMLRFPILLRGEGVRWHRTRRGQSRQESARRDSEEVMRTRGKRDNGRLGERSLTNSEHEAGWPPASAQEKLPIAHCAKLGAGLHA